MVKTCRNKKKARSKEKEKVKINTVSAASSDRVPLIMFTHLNNQGKC